MSDTIVLAGDIGGTHARLARFRVDAGSGQELVDEWTGDSQGYDGPAPVVREYLERRGLEPGDLRGICIAVAGPIRDGKLRVPNLGWTIDVEGFGADVGLPAATLINDFAAIGHGVLTLGDDDFEELQAGSPKEEAPVAVLGPGTGLGHAFLVWADGRYRVQPSEGGHADFAPRTETQWRLAEYLRDRHGHASWERVVSGPGLLEVYRFLVHRDPDAESEDVRAELESDDAPAVISRHGIAGTDPLCAEAMEIFGTALGTVAGDFALAVEAFGGVYIAGGIAPQILEGLRAGPFLEAFRAKGRLADLLEAIPVRVVLDERVGLRGAARVAARDD